MQVCAGVEHQEKRQPRRVKCVRQILILTFHYDSESAIVNGKQADSLLSSQTNPTASKQTASSVVPLPPAHPNFATTPSVVSATPNSFGSSEISSSWLFLSFTYRLYTISNHLRSRHDGSDVYLVSSLKTLTSLPSSLMALKRINKVTLTD